MFQHLTDFAYQRTKKQALGFYIAYLALIIAIGGLLGIFIQATSPSQKDTSVTLYYTGSLLAILASLLLALTVAVSKRIYTQVSVILVIILSGVFGSMAGGMLGLIPVAYLTTRENKNKGTTKGEEQEESRESRI
jgi:drug/metabolite transporter (DMT)-like permease